MNDAIAEKVQSVVRWLKETPASSGYNLQSAPHNLLRWFKGLPLVLKIASVVVGALLLLTVLSPLGLVAAAILFGVSLIGIVVRVGQRRSVKRWGIAATFSLVLVLVFASASDAFYGAEFIDNTNSNAGETEGKDDVKGDGINPAKGKSDADRATGNVSDQSNDVNPKLEGIVDSWRSSRTESPLFLPTYLPFPVAEAVPDPNYKGYYHIRSDIRDQGANHIRIILLGRAFVPSGYASSKRIEIDGRDLPYSENFPSTMATGRGPGQYAILLWVKSEQGEEHMYQVEMNTLMKPLPPEEWRKVVRSLKRIDP